MLDLSNPFPGLRCFLSEEDYLFFGRHEQIEDLLRRLRTNRLVAVVGTSGSGKSSLVRAGLIPAVLGGGMAQAGSAWEIAVMRPGGSPMAHLARALCEAGLYDADAEDALFHLQATLSRSRNGLIEAVRQSQGSGVRGQESGSKLLLVVDQFEELFRFNRASATSQEEAIGFVNLLLHATQQVDQNVYVVLTMRSDFLGECSQFLGLAEAVNDGEFLIPRMTRDQIQEAIEGPIRVRGAEIAPRLLFRLLNDVEDNQDQLPVLQHALMRTWDLWQRSQSTGVAALDLDHYEATGDMHEALSRHADEIFDAFPTDPHRTAAARIFKALTERGPDGRGIRRPTRLGQLASIAAVEEPIVHRVIEAYRAPGVTFLMPPVSSALEDHSVIDISHESLMRVWNRLRGWVEEEAQSARIYHRLQESAVLHAEKRADLYHDPDLQIALSWREACQPNPAWAGQYGGGLDQAMAFLDTSREAAEREEKEREAARQRELERARQLAKTQAKAARMFKRFAGGLAAGLCLAVALTIWALLLRQEAKRQEAAANQQRQVAQEKEQEADRERTLAQNAEREMQKLAAQAEAAKEIAQRENYRSTIKLAESMLQGDVQARYRVADILWGAQPELRGWEWGHLMARCPLEEWSLQTNHGGLDALAASADDRFLATAGRDGTVALWDSWTRKELWRRKAGRALTLEIDFQSRYVGVGSAEQSAPAFRILDIASGRIVHEAAETGSAHIAFSSSGKDLYVLRAEKLERMGTDTWTRLASTPRPRPKLLAWLKLFVDPVGAYVGVHNIQNEGPSRNDRRMALFDAHTLRPVADLDAIVPTFASNLWSMAKPVLHSGLGRIVYSDGPRLFSNSLAPDGSFRGPEVPRIVHPTVVDHLVHDARSETTIAASNDGTVTVRDADGEMRNLSHGLPIRGLALFPDGRFVTGGADGLLKCWRPNQSASLAVNTAASPSPASEGVLAFANNGGNILYRTWEPNRHFLYDTGDLTYRSFSPPEGGLYGDRFPLIQPGTNELVADRETGLAFYRLSPDGTGLTRTMSTDMARPFSAAFDASGRIMVASSRGPELAVFDVRSNQRLPVPEAKGIGQVSVNPAGTRAALLTGANLQVWDVATGRLLNRLDWDASSFTATDGERKRLSIHQEEVPLRIPAFHPNGDLLAFIQDSENSSSLVLWDTALGKMRGSIPGEPGRRITACVFSADGDRLLTPCSDAKMRLWDWRIGKELFALSDAAWTVNVAAHPDGLTIAYSGWSPSLRIARALPWNELTRRDGNFYRAVDDLWTYTAQLSPEWKAFRSTQSGPSTLISPRDGETILADEAETLGDIQRRRGQPTEALAHYTRAIATRQKLVLDEPRKAQLQYRLATVYEKCLAVEAAGDPTKGAAVLQEAIECWQRLVSSGRPHSLSWRYLVDFRPRYSAALGAALAAAGQGKGQPPLDDSAKAKLRRQTLDALVAELTAWRKFLESGPTEARPFVVRTLSDWRQDRDLAGIRDPAALAVLPAEDQKACTQLWADVGELLKKAEEPANNADRLRLAQLAYTRKQFAAATRLFAEALAGEPKLGDDPRKQHRYIAACAAAQSAIGQGQDKPPLDDGAKAKLRGQARDWLKAELTAWGTLLDTGPPQGRSAIVQTLSHWRQDSDLAGIRDPAALAKLPAEERAAFIQFWADVAESLKKANARLAAYFQEQLPEARKSLPKDSPQLAGFLAQIGLALLQAEQWAEAEPFLRESLAIREQGGPDLWTTFNTQSMLGGALLGQKKYADAEPLLLKGYQGMKEREKTIPAVGKDRLPEAVERLLQLYEALAKEDEAAKWRTELRKPEQPAKSEKKP